MMKDEPSYSSRWRKKEKNDLLIIKREKAVTTLNVLKSCSENVKKNLYFQCRKGGNPPGRVMPFVGSFTEGTTGSGGGGGNSRGSREVSYPFIFLREKNPSISCSVGGYGGGEKQIPCHGGDFRLLIVKRSDTAFDWRGKKKVVKVKNLSRHLSKNGKRAVS